VTHAAQWPYGPFANGILTPARAATGRGPAGGDLKNCAADRETVMPPSGDPASASTRDIPSIERLRQLPRARALDAVFGRDAVLDALRGETAALRASLTATGATGEAALSIDVESLADRILAGAEARLEQLFRSRLRSVINATGVILHTNLGRAPLAAAALERIAEIGAGYASLEYDLARGARGRRDVHAEPLLCHLAGPNAQAAIVVNNNAAAVLLMLSALAQGREVIISRGELIEIGGGFRVPDVMRQSGATLREVGTTNRTRAADYAAAISDRTALILRVHPSNFVIEGFTARPALEELTAIGRQFNVPVAEDLGSGFFEGAGANAGAAPGAGAVSLADEPSVQATLRAGADVVAFSGDKLFGGPQAGIIAGRRDLVDTMRHHPLMRALRVDKLTYAALETTLLEHVRGRAAESVPVIRMLSMKVDEIEARAIGITRQLTNARIDIIDGFSAIGGGSAPGERLPTRLLAIDASSADALLTRLREYDPPVIARIDQDRVVLDLRTVTPDQDVTLASAIRRCLSDRA
jgi:L-seryl-tRNA(Ser) seleniumtransferase